MKGIILAAGMGTRMGKYTKDLPKCMLSFNGKSLVEWQMAALRKCGVNDIVIVRGYQPHTISFADVEYRDNPSFASTNMVASLAAARDALLNDKDGCVVCYGDIIYEPRLIEAMLQVKDSVGVLVDEEWQALWQARSSNWREDVESLAFSTTGKVVEIGSPHVAPEKCMARYVGILSFSAQGIKEFFKIYDELSLAHQGSAQRWRHSRSFSQAYMTCMLQEMIDRKVAVQAVPVKHGWLEFDTAEDYEVYLALLENRKLEQFFRF